MFLIQNMQLEAGNDPSDVSFDQGKMGKQQIVQIRCDRDKVSSHLKYYQLSSEILKYKLILFRSGHFDHDMETI